MAIVKHVVRYAVIAGLVGGAAALVAGPDRIAALASQTRGQINAAIDKTIDDPIALREQIRKLEAQYPEKIAAVRSDLSELREQVTQLRAERAESEMVVALAHNDLQQMHGMITRAESAQASAAADGGPAIVRVVFQNESLKLNDAYGKANRIEQVASAYTNRVDEIDRDLGYLSEQESRLATLLDQLETEHAEFQAQMWQMDRQINTIARNERLIDMMEKRQRTIDQASRYDSGSLQELSGKFASIRSKQEARLEALSTSGTTMNYEERARFELNSQLKAPARKFEVSPRPTVIEITPETRQPEPAQKPLASRPL